MRSRVMVLALCLVFAIAGSALAAGKLPTGNSFHVDVRALSLFDMNTLSVVNDDTDDIYTEANLGSMIGSTGVGTKIGYLIAGHHDVGGHFLFTYGNVTSVYTEDATDEDTVQNTTTIDLRLAPYYNYNFHVQEWIMPYVGALVGLDLNRTFTENPDVTDSGVTTNDVGLIGGIEGGVKLFPFEHVAFDIGVMGLGGPVTRTVTYDDDNIDEATWAGINFDIGLHGGLNIYF